ncbi:MAG: hypothetical protein JNK23_10645 [Opitutaceae bacterium]|nr:hypothetical protein [Opitutaceae bacterium]
MPTLQPLSFAGLTITFEEPADLVEDTFVTGDGDQLVTGDGDTLAPGS